MNEWLDVFYGVDRKESFWDRIVGIFALVLVCALVTLLIAAAGAL